MNKEKRIRNRSVLTLTALCYVAFVMLVTVIISVGLTVLLVSFKVIPSLSEAREEIFYVVRFMTVVHILAGICVAGFVNAILLKQVNKVINSMNELADGNYKIRLDFGKALTKHPTFKEICVSFNSMAEELEHTEMLRSDFVNNFSHEFKTPIVSIAGFAKLLKRNHLSQEQREEYLDIIEEESLRLSSMATNVLHVTKIENQTILSDITSFNLSEQLRNVVVLLEPKWSKKHIEFDIDLEEYQICANEEMLKQVWINLIENAIKFSPDFGMVKITAEEKKEQVFVSVLNTGSEISLKEQKRIFSKFYQADQSHASEGNGIGLALVKGIVRLHKGEVFVESKNQTTTFTVQLPKMQKK